MNTTAPAPVVRWRVIGFRESVYQACPGAPVQPGGCCEKCGQGIRYVVTLKSSDGQALNVGQDCAVTIQGGPALAEIRRAERAWRLEQWLASPERARQEAERKEREEAASARAAAAEGEHALALFGLRAIQASPNCSGREKERAKARVNAILAGAENAVRFGDDGWELGLAWTKSTLPASHYVGQVGDRIDVVALLEAMIPIDTAWGRSYVQKFRAEDGAALVWFSKGGALNGGDVGAWVRIRGTIKAHSVYQGVPQTELSRCKTELA